MSHKARRVGRPAYLWTGSAALGLLVFGGCRSHFMDATVENDTQGKLSVIEVDYPNASFGVSTLAPLATYSYRFKPQASGKLQLTYSDATGTTHTAVGPSVTEGDQGRVTVHIGEHNAVNWSVTTHP